MQRFRALPARKRPEAWFTYHVYHKAPDWLGPDVAAGLGIPYIVAEASYAPKQAAGPWDLGYRATERVLAEAAVVIALTRYDMACLAPLAGDRLAYLPPFMDMGEFENVPPRATARKALMAAHPALDPSRAWLLTVAMMREGDKLQSYKHLASALGRLNGDDWQLLVAGDGEARGRVEALFGGHGKDSIIFAGALDGGQLNTAYAAADIFLWPAWGEAYGMAILEAQAAGLPVIAGASRGVPDVVKDGETALLVPLEEMDGAETMARDFAGAVRTLLDDQAGRRNMAAAAHRFVGGKRTLSHAAKTLDDVLAACREGARP